MPKRIIRVAEDFSRYPAGRYKTDGPASGERFREQYLLPILRAEEHATIALDGVRGYGSSFLEEAFGGLVRAGFPTNSIKASFEIQSQDSSLVDEVWEYVEHGAEESRK